MRIPPFANTLRNLPPTVSADVCLYFGEGDTWKPATFRHRCELPVLVLPTSDPVEKFDWRAVKGWDVLAVQIGDCPPEHIPRMAWALLRAGARIVRVVAGTRLVVYRRNVSTGETA